MQNPLANFIGIFSLVRDDRGFQVNPLCRHDITSLFPPSGNRGYIRNLDVLQYNMYILLFLCKYVDIKPPNVKWDREFYVALCAYYCYVT